MSDIDIASLDLGELELLLQSALNPAVPVEVLYATLDRLSTSPDWRGGAPIQHSPPGPADMTTGWSAGHTGYGQPPSMPDMGQADQANAVLRGGPFDGHVVEADPRAEVVRTVHSVVYIYRPTTRIDEELPGLCVFALDRSEQLG